MDDETKRVMAEFLTRAFREGGEAAITSAIAGFCAAKEKGVKHLTIDEVILYLEQIKKSIIARYELPLGAHGK